MFDASMQMSLIYSACGVSLLLSIFFVVNIFSIKVSSTQRDDEETHSLVERRNEEIERIGSLIQSGTSAYFVQEYLVSIIFALGFSLVVFILVDILGQNTIKFRCYATIAYLVGVTVCAFSGFLGMQIALGANYRATFLAQRDMDQAFKLAYRGSLAAGFICTGVATAMLLSIVLCFWSIFSDVDTQESDKNLMLMQLVAAYGLGASSVALFGRVGGGIYTKAADVGADLVGKIIHTLSDSPEFNPATIANTVGDNIGGIAGNGADLFSSITEASCAVLIITATIPEMSTDSAQFYNPMLISAMGIFACLLVSVWGVFFQKVDSAAKVDRFMRIQGLAVTILGIGGMAIVSFCAFPASWEDSGTTRTNIAAFILLSVSVCFEQVNSFWNKVYLKQLDSFEQELFRHRSEGPESIIGITTRYFSTIAPLILIGLLVTLSLNLLGCLGLGLAAVAMLATLPIGYAFDIFSALSLNIHAIAVMADLGAEELYITQLIQSAGEDADDMRSGFSLCVAATASLAIYGAFINVAKNPSGELIHEIDIGVPWFYCSFILGAILPYTFATLTMKSVGSAAQKIIEEVKNQYTIPEVKSGAQMPDIDRCISVSSATSLQQVIYPGIMIVTLPIFLGVLIHPVLVLGLIPGALLSGATLSITLSKNKEVSTENTKITEKLKSQTILPSSNSKKQSKAIVVADTYGDPLKDTSGPSLNILIKLMAMISLVFALSFQHTAFLSKFLDIS